MSRALNALAILFVSVALLGASGGDDHGSPIVDLLLLWFNFALLLGVIVYFARKPVAEFFAARHRVVKSEIDEARELLAEAERRNSEWQRKVAELDSDLENIRHTARQRAQDERAAILAEAQESAERIQRDALAAVEQEARRASAELRAEAAQLASEMAARIVSERIGDGDRERLVDEFIAHIDASARN